MATLPPVRVTVRVLDLYRCWSEASFDHPNVPTLEVALESIPPSIRRVLVGAQGFKIEIEVRKVV